MMSDSDESAVLVDLNDVPELKDEVDEGEENSGGGDFNHEQGYPAQIVSIGTEENSYAFKFHKECWNGILSRVPMGWKVAVVSVVGAFRTGKSFLLSCFLRYLYVLERSKQKTDEPLEDMPWYKQFQSLGKGGFQWKAGSERNTTGIWMWSHPFFLDDKNGEPMAVLLVDTQGMFDHETTMALTASIFGLSTLLSSYQIYNVDKRIQEDNLQQLALFTEYARAAMGKGEQERKPFQKIEFLVRDWQHFEEENEEDLDALENSVVEYLAKILADRDAEDLQGTRDQIQTCFEDISCYALCHPGFIVSKKKFNGDIASLEKLFVALLDRYCKRVFSSETLQPKQIHDRELTAVEFGTYIQTYAELFTSGAKFPTAATLLEATATANNNNAVNLAVAEYKDLMDRVSGPKCSNYISPQELLEEHEKARNKALKVFRSVATFGSNKSIETSQTFLTTNLEDSWQLYESLNKSRNPLLGFETYLIPTAMAVIAYILRWLTDLTCSPYSKFCKAGSELLSHAYAVVFCFLAILMATKVKQIQELLTRVRAAVAIVVDTKEKQE